MEVMTLYSDDYETSQAECGENVKAKLKGIEEDVCINLPDSFAKAVCLLTYMI